MAFNDTDMPIFAGVLEAQEKAKQPSSSQAEQDEKHREVHKEFVKVEAMIHKYYEDDSGGFAQRYWTELHLYRQKEKETQTAEYIAVLASLESVD